MSLNDSILKAKMKALLIGYISVPNDGNLEEAYHITGLYGEADTVEEALTERYNFQAKRHNTRRQYKLIAMYDQSVVSFTMTSDNMSISNFVSSCIPEGVKYVYFWHLNWYNREQPVLRSDFFDCMGYAFDEDDAFAKACMINKDAQPIIIDKISVSKGAITDVVKGSGLSVSAKELGYDRKICKAFTDPKDLYDYCMRFCLAEEREYDSTGKFIYGRTIINDEPCLVMEDYFNPACYKLLMRRNDPLGFGNGLGWYDNDPLDRAWKKAKAKTQYKTHIGPVG